jgi:hypothetical protein
MDADFEEVWKTGTKTSWLPFLLNFAVLPQQLRNLA